MAINKLKIKYKRPILFYTLSTIIPRIFWIIAGKLSQTPNPNMMFISVLGFIGLLTPMIVAFWLIHNETGLKKDLGNRIFNFKNIKPVYLILTFFLMLGSILLAQAISLLFGYSANQFSITGYYTFSSGVFPVWFLLIMAPVIEELGRHICHNTTVFQTRFPIYANPLYLK
jgi:uncharacterized Tic20 family protein